VYFKAGERQVFDKDQFIEDCVNALSEDAGHKAVREIVARAVSDPASVMRGLGDPTEGGINVVYNTDKLTILNLVWAPMMTLMPHNHNMWAVIGLYSGREDNIFWRRIKDDPNGRIEAAGAIALDVGCAEALGKDIVHSVTNPIPRFTGGLHVYGGDFFADGRSEWDAEQLTEQPYNVENARERFEQANARL
jgi:predicted metal-dependent enzyme (double-stranded beta helix superfamily)